MAPVEPKTRAVEPILKRLGAAIKAFALYPPTHPTCVATVENLLGVLRPRLREGPFAVRVTRRSLSHGGVAFDGDPHADLAMHLYTRRLAAFTVLPDVTPEELSAFLAVAGMDRPTLLARGGAEHLLWQAGVGNVQVTELILEEEHELDTLGLSAFYALLGRGVLSPQERERIVDILRAGPEHAAKLLDNVYQMTGEILEGLTAAERGEHVYRAVTSLDRVILDEPFEDQSLLYAHLVRAHLLVGESLRPLLGGQLVARAEQDVTARLILDHLAPDEVASLLLRYLDGGGDPEGAGGVLRVFAGTLGRAEAVLASVEEGLPAGSPLAGRFRELLRAARAVGPGAREAELAVEFEIDDSQLAVGHEEFGHRTREARAIDEAEAVREAVRTLVDVLRYETEPEGLKEIAAALVGHVPWLVDRQEFPLLTTILRGLREIAATEGDRGQVAVGILRQVAQGAMLDSLLQALWSRRHTPMEEQIVGCLEVLGDNLVTPLVNVLGTEPRAGMRAVLCEVLVRVGRNHIDELGSFVSDSRWYLVRNIAGVLGQLGGPDAVNHLARLMRHPEYRVRREVVEALARIGTEEAQGRLAVFLDDADERIQLKTIQSLTAAGARRALPKLLALLEAPDPWQRRFGLKQAALEALERLGDRRALPVLERLARSWLTLGPRGRELRDQARRALDAIQGPAPADTPAGPSARAGDGGQP